MKLIIDTNVFLDVILKREPLCFASAKVLDLSTNGDAELIMPAHAAATIFYIVEKNQGHEAAVKALSICLNLAHVGALDETAVLLGISYGFRDVEDSFVAAIASKAKADYIVTNNVKDFGASPVPAVTPAELLARL